MDVKWDEFGIWVRMKMKPMCCRRDFTLGRPRCISPFLYPVRNSGTAKRRNGGREGRVGPPHTAHTDQRSMGDESGTRMRDADDHRHWLHG